MNHDAGHSRRKPHLFRSDLHARQQVIQQLQPLPLNGPRQLGLKQVLVFTDDGQIMLSLVSARGTVTVPLARKTAAGLAHRLMQQLI